MYRNVNFSAQSVEFNIQCWIFNIDLTSLAFIATGLNYLIINSTCFSLDFSVSSHN